MTVACPLRDDPTSASSKVVDDAGQSWRHDNPAELYRWVSRRNELLRTIALVPRSSTARP